MVTGPSWDVNSTFVFPLQRNREKLRRPYDVSISDQGPPIPLQESGGNGTRDETRSRVDNVYTADRSATVRGLATVGILTRYVYRLCRQ